MSLRIGIEPQSRWLTLAAGESLRDALFRAGIEFPCGGKSLCGGCQVQLLAGEIEPDTAEKEYFSAEDIASGWRLACRLKPQNGMRLRIEQWQHRAAAPILSDTQSIEPGCEETYRIAIDLGTTTVVAQLLNMATGEVLSVVSRLNPQAAYGADLMSRIDYARNDEGFAQLVNTVRDCAGAMISELIHSSGIDSALVDRAILVGNTAMHHLFSGIDVAPLASVPFSTIHGGLRRLESAELGWKGVDELAVWVLPCLGGFVGGDVLAGLLATQLHRERETSLLVDLGTNGEIVLGNRQQLICASTAAGPAFEGGGILMGMQAAAGAIDAVELKDGELCCHVIGQQSARGICGSGLVDAVACGLELGWIDPSGRITREDKRIPLTSDVYLSQQDIRQLQLAKAAIAAGIELLCAQMAVSKEAVINVFLAGAFGNYVDVSSAMRIGLLEFTQHQIKPVGNTALQGARLALGLASDVYDEQLREEAADDTDKVQLPELTAITEKVVHFSLGESQAFQSLFIEKTKFPESSATPEYQPEV